MRQLRLFVSLVLPLTGLAFIVEPVLAQSLSQDQRAGVVYRGMEALKAGQHSVAIAEFTKLINAAPSNGEYRSLRGAAYFDSGNNQKAAADFEEAVRCGDNRPLTKNSLNSAVANTLAASVPSDGKTVSEINKVAQEALEKKDFQKAMGYYNVLAGQSKSIVHQTGLFGRAAVFLMMGRKANARIDLDELKREGTELDLSDLVKAAAQSEAVQPGADEAKQQSGARPNAASSTSKAPARKANGRMSEKETQDWLNQRYGANKKN